MKVTLKLSKKEYEELHDLLPPKAKVAAFRQILDPTHYNQKTFARKYGPKKTKKS